MVHKMRFLVVSFQLPVISYQLRGFVGSYNELDCHKQVITDNYRCQFRDFHGISGDRILHRYHPYGIQEVFEVVKVSA